MLSDPTANEFTKALAECRDALPIPEPGSPTEDAWAAAMADPLNVPYFVQASFAEQVREVEDLELENLRLINHCEELQRQLNELKNKIEVQSYGH